VLRTIAYWYILDIPHSKHRLKTVEWEDFKMASKKKFGKKLKLIAIRRKNAPRWADIRKFGLKKARARRIRITKKHWRRGRNKI
jgi:hypothetical protein